MIRWLRAFWHPWAEALAEVKRIEARRHRKMARWRGIAGARRRRLRREADARISGTRA